jgi:hypothetical protein
MDDGLRGSLSLISKIGLLGRSGIRFQFSKTYILKIVSHGTSFEDIFVRRNEKN